MILDAVTLWTMRGQALLFWPSGRCQATLTPSVIRACRNRWLKKEHTTMTFPTWKMVWFWFSWWTLIAFVYLLSRLYSLCDRWLSSSKHQLHPFTHISRDVAFPPAITDRSHPSRSTPQREPRAPEQVIRSTANRWTSAQHLAVSRHSSFLLLLALPQHLLYLFAET